MVDKQSYEDVVAEVEASKASVDLLTAKIRSANGFEANESDLNVIYANLQYINEWAQLKINDLEKDQVLNEFLTSLKALMTDYSAVFEVVTETGVGYGENYGEAGSAEAKGIKVSVTKDGVEASKVFETLSLSEDDI